VNKIRKGRQSATKLLKKFTCKETTAFFLFLAEGFVNISLLQYAKIEHCLEIHKNGRTDISYRFCFAPYLLNGFVQLFLKSKESQQISKPAHPFTEAQSYVPYQQQADSSHETVQ
jgi:hypothetical protein